MVTKTSHLPIRYFLALLWAHPILHISTIRVNPQNTLPFLLSQISPCNKPQRPRGGVDYSSTLSLTCARNEVGGQRNVPAALLLGKTKYPFYRRPGGSQGRSGRVRKIAPPPGCDSRTVQPMASRYTYCAMPTFTFYRTSWIYRKYTTQKLYHSYKAAGFQKILSQWQALTVSMPNGLSKWNSSTVYTLGQI